MDIYPDIAAIDTPRFDLGDPAALLEECHRSKGLGFTGKVAVHPAQISVINKVFSPEPRALENAARIMEETQGKFGIYLVDGQMVGPPMMENARRVLELAERIGMTVGS